MARQGSTSIPIWSPAPPTHQPTYYPVVWPKPMQPVLGFILAQQLEGCWVHPIREGKKWRTPPCTGRELGCDICGPKARYRWQGYLPLWNAKIGRTVIAQVTKEAARNCPLLGNPKELLRGRLISLTRLGEENNSPVLAEFYDNAPPEKLPACPNVREALLNLWGLAPAMSLFANAEEVPHA